MYMIFVELQLNKIPQDRVDAMTDKHREWFKTYFDAGKFLLLGPCPDVHGAGLIIAQAESRDEIEEILSTDVYYEDKLAKYTVHEFKAVMYNESIKNYVG